MLLCFLLMVKIVLITMLYFLLIGAHTETRICLLFILPCQWSGWELARNLEGTQTRQLTQTNQRDIAYTIRCSSIKDGKREWQRRMFGVMVFVFPNNHHTWWGLLSWKWLNIWLPMGSNKWIPCFALHANCLVSCLYLSPRIFFFF